MIGRTIETIYGSGLVLAIAEYDPQEHSTHTVTEMKEDLPPMKQPASEGNFCRDDNSIPECSLYYIAVGGRLCSRMWVAEDEVTKKPIIW